MVKASAVRGKTKTVGQHDAVRQRAHRTVEVDHVKMAGLRRIATEDPEGERADIDPPCPVGGEIIEAGGAGDGVEGKQRPRVAVGQPDEGDVASANHQAIRGMQRHAADAAPLGDHRRHRAGAIEQIHAAIDDVAEIKPVGRVPDGTFDQAEARRDTLHLLPPGATFWGHYRFRPALEEPR